MKKKREEERTDAVARVRGIKSGNGKSYSKNAE